MNPAFAYVYDASLEDERRKRELDRFELEIARLGIQGRILRLGQYLQGEPPMAEFLATEGLKNVIFVGNDELFFRWLPSLVGSAHAVGVVPLRATPLSTLLGIPDTSISAGIMAARVVETFDVGKVNDHYFFSEVFADATTVALHLEGSYAISARTPSPLSIRNVGMDQKTGAAKAFHRDGMLEVVLETERERQSGFFGLWKKAEKDETRVFFERAAIKAKDELEVFVDGRPFKAKGLQFSIVPAALTLIVGPERRLLEAPLAREKAP